MHKRHWREWKGQGMGGEGERLRASGSGCRREGNKSVTYLRSRQKQKQAVKSWMMNAGYSCRVRLAIIQSRKQENSWRSAWNPFQWWLIEKEFEHCEMCSSKYFHRKNQKLKNSPIIRKYTLHGGLGIVRGRRAMSPQVHLGMLMVEPFGSWWHHEKQCKWIERLRQWLRTERGTDKTERPSQ